MHCNQYIFKQLFHRFYPWCTLPNSYFIGQEEIQYDLVKNPAEPIDQKMWGGSQIKNILLMLIPNFVFQHCFKKMIRAGVEGYREREPSP